MNKVVNPRIVVVLLGLSFVLAPLPGPLLGQEENAVAKVVARMNSLGGFRADISMSSEGGVVRGALSYQGGKVHLQLSDGRVIASSGRHLLVYSPATRVAGKQDMGPGGGGLGWLLNGFDTKVRGTSAELVATDPNRSVQKVQLQWGADYILRRLVVKSKNREQPLIIQLSNLRPVKSFSAGVFSWKPPAGSRTVENPRNQRN